jgi:FkbM family methyltransferase
MNLHKICSALANDATSNPSEPLPRVELYWYDRIARWLTQRVPRLVARTVIRIHRLFVGDRLTAIQVWNFRMAVNPQDNCGHHLFYYGEYEPQQVELWRQLLDRGREAIVLDIGANIGYYSLLAAAHANVSLVLSFEPNPLVLPTLRHNAALNPCLAGKITIMDVAVGDTNGTVRFHRNYEAHNLGLGSIRAQTADNVTVEVPIVRLDSFLKARGVDRVDLIKIDVEGAEHLVVSGLVGWWEDHPRPTMVIEVHPAFLNDFASSVPALFATLTTAGYRLRSLRQDGELETASSTFKAICWVVAEPNGN